MTEPETWATHEPPWLAKLRPDLVEEQPASQERTAEQRAADLVAQLERAAAGRVPPALAGAGWGEVDVAEYDDQVAEPIVRRRVPGPWPCQLPEPIDCPDCDRQFDTKLQLAVHAVDHRRQAEREQRRAERRNTKAGTATKPKPGARTKRKRRR